MKKHYDEFAAEELKEMEAYNERCHKMAPELKAKMNAEIEESEKRIIAENEEMQKKFAVKTDVYEKRVSMEILQEKNRILGKYGYSFLEIYKFDEDPEEVEYFHSEIKKYQENGWDYEIVEIEKKDPMDSFIRGYFYEERYCRVK